LSATERERPGKAALTVALRLFVCQKLLQGSRLCGTHASHLEGGKTFATVGTRIHRRKSAQEALTIEFNKLLRIINSNFKIFERLILNFAKTF
jgi:hypothetical protein